MIGYKLMRRKLMILEAVAGTETITLGRDFTFETAYEFILEHDNYEANPWLEGYDLFLIDGEEQWIFESDCWVPL
jgi:hypothetical protein